MQPAIAEKQLLSSLQTITPHQLKSWSRCQKQFYYQVVRQFRWPTEQRNFRLGQGVHKLLDYQSRGLDCELLVSHATPDIQNAWQLLMAHPITQLPIIANEWAFMAPISVDTGNTQNTWLTGRVDRIARDGDKILVIDWKTGTAVPRLPELDWQTIVYLYAVAEAVADLGLSGITPEQIEFVYVEVKQAVRLHCVPYSQNQHEAARAKLQETVLAIASAAYSALPYALPAKCPDMFCAYRPVCGILQNS